MGNESKMLSDKENADLFDLLKRRFEVNMRRHPDVSWEYAAQKLKTSKDKLWSLNEMEKTGGEPDIIGFDAKTEELLFVDCSPETPKERRSLCYDAQALESRKENRPKGSAVGMADAMGIVLLDEQQYRMLQSLGEFDLKTSSWIKTPDSIRELGGALFCDCRYDTVFVYHNGAESYYSSRGFRGLLKL